jgi:hypothetical protein
MNDQHRHLRQLIWLYFWLLIFEGALRKWLVPGLSNALLIVRDPVVVAIYLLALRDRVFPVSGFVLWTGLLALLSFLASFAGIGNVFVTIYGIHANFLHLPLIFVMPRVLRSEDVRRIGYALLAVLPLMALLSVKQFKAGPLSSWNVGAGGEVGGQLYAAQGKVRASGTFSFATGLASYLALSAAFLLDDLLGSRRYARWLAYAAMLSLVLSLLVSGSRTAVLSVAIVCILAVVAGIRRPGQISATIHVLIITAGIVGGLALWTSLYREGMDVHRERFEGGGGVREGIIYRFAHDFVAAGQALGEAPVLGFGLGTGTNVGSSILRGKREFALGEGEWERVILEGGVVLGAGYLALRVGMLFAVIGAAYTAFRAGRILPLLLVGAGGLDLANGQFGQPTTLGFAVFIAGLALAAVESANPPPPTAESSLAPVSATAIRGRSSYAEQLHRSDEKDVTQ